VAGGEHKARKKASDGFEKRKKKKKNK